MMRVYTAGRARPLAGRLGSLLAEQPADPMVPEWLAVPTEGMRRWLLLELARSLGASGPSRADGVAANFVRAYPGSLRSAVLAADRTPGAPDPWELDRLVWPVLAELERRRRASGDEPAPARAASLGPSAYATARRVADLFDRYNLHRPSMVRAWAAGRAVDGGGRKLPPQARWQFDLWYAVRGTLAEPSPAERLPDLLERVRSGDLVPDLPQRLLLFGFAMLPAGDFLDVALAIAARHDVHCFVLDPGTPSTVATGSDASAGNGPPAPGGGTIATGHRLLRSWGRPHREMVEQLAAAAERDGLAPAERVDGVRTAQTTLLSRLQEAIRSDGSSAQAVPLDPADRSVHFHACYGALRQVEVVRDALGHLLGDPTSELLEDDVLIVCPDLDRFLPHIEAVFGRTIDRLADAQSGGCVTSALRFRYQVADRTLRTVNPVLGATTDLLELASGPLDAASVLDLLSLEPVRHRFGFDEEDLASIATWARATAVRWGLDANHRERFGLPASIATNTWQAALDQLLVGTSVDDGGWGLAIGGIAPSPVEGGDVEVLGRMAEALRHVGALVEAASAPRTVTAWVDVVQSACDGLLATPGNRRWQLDALHRLLREIVESATDHDAVASAALTFTDLRRLVDERLHRGVGRADSFRGGITVASLTPLRWVPFRIVCLLGMDQAAFGTQTASSDDLLASAPQAGDRDPRAEERQSLLEAVLAAGDHLVVLRDGHDVRTNQRVPRSVVAAELFDAVSSLVEHEGDDEPPGLEVDHPRHAFDRRCFEGGALIAGTPWGFDPTDLDGARARLRREHRPTPFLEEALPAVDQDVIELDALVSFFENPTRHFLRARIGASLPPGAGPGPGLLAVEPDALEQWGLGTRLLAARLAGIDERTWVARERAGGTLLPGVLADRLAGSLAGEVDALVVAAGACGRRAQVADSIEVDVSLDDGTRLVGLVPLELGPPERGRARVSFTRPRPHDRLRSWLELMALVAHRPDSPWRSAVVTRSPTSSSTVPEVVDLVVAPDGDAGRTASEALAVAVHCYRRGSCEPLPIFPRLSSELYRGAATDDHWHAYGGLADGDDPAVRLVFGELELGELLELPARAGDPPGPGSRAERWARLLWSAYDRSIVDRGTAAARGRGRSGR